MSDNKGLWVLSEAEHDKLAMLAWYSYHMTIKSTLLWDNVPDEEKNAWKNAVAGLLLYGLSEQHGMDAVVIDYD